MKMKDAFEDTPFPYGGEPPAQRHSETSIAAADSVKHSANRWRREVVKYLTAFGPSTDEEMQIGIPLAPNSQRPRRCELVEMGRVRDSGEKRLTRSRRKAVVWELTP